MQSIAASLLLLSFVSAPPAGFDPARRSQDEKAPAPAAPSGQTAKAVLSSSDEPRYEYRTLATNRTGTMQKELNEAADAGFRFMGVMKGGTSFGGAEVVSILVRPAGETKARYEYKLLATSKTSTMQKELQEAGDAGFEYRDQTVGGEVIVILERDREAPIVSYEYRLLATKKTGTMQKELQEIGDQGFEFVGVTVAPTTFGGSEIVSILRRQVRK
jgi:hypothetical protein